MCSDYIMVNAKQPIFSIEYAYQLYGSVAIGICNYPTTPHSSVSYFPFNGGTSSPVSIPTQRSNTHILTPSLDTNPMCANKEKQNEKEQKKQTPRPDPSSIHIQCAIANGFGKRRKQVSCHEVLPLRDIPSQTKQAPCRVTYEY